MYGVLTTPPKKSGALLIFVHGFTGHKNEHIFYNGARFFAKRGMATFRFDLYSGEKGGRTLTDCGISTHAADTDTVVRFFRKKFRKIFVAGHSLDGLTIMRTDTNAVDGIVLWDSSRRSSAQDEKDFKYNICLGAYTMSWGTEFLVSKKMHEEWLNFPKPKAAVANINKPIKIIVAGNGMLIRTGKEHFKYAKEPKEFSVIQGASHNFDENGTAQKLFAETHKFLKKLM